MNSCINAIFLTPENFRDRIIKFYQDVPYAARFPEFTPNMLLAIEQAGFELELEENPIDEVLPKKLRLISLYASQFKLHALREDIERSAKRSHSDASQVERFWTARQLPAAPIPNSIVPTSHVLVNHLKLAVGWIIRNKQAPIIRIILLVPTGQWQSDIALFCDFFPRAQFELYVGPDAEAEISRFPCERVTVYSVNKGSKHWVALGVRLALRRGAPTLFNPGARYKEAAWLAKLWLKSDTLILRSMNELSRAFRVVEDTTRNI